MTISESEVTPELHLRLIHGNPLLFKVSSREDWFGAEQNDRRLTRKWDVRDLNLYNTWQQDKEITVDH